MHMYCNYQNEINDVELRMNEDLKGLHNCAK